MPTQTLAARRRADGLCIDCAAPRTSDEGGTASRCASCAERVRARERRYREHCRTIGKTLPAKRIRDARRNAHQCTDCGTPLTPADSDFRICAPCRARAVEVNRASRQRGLDRKAGIPADADRHYPVGAHEYLTGESRCHAFHLNHAAQSALFALHRAYRETEIAAGRRPKSRILSHLIRAVLRPGTVAPTRSPPSSARSTKCKSSPTSTAPAATPSTASPANPLTATARLPCAHY